MQVSTHDNLSLLPLNALVFTGWANVGLAFTRDCPPMNLDVSRRLRLESNQFQLKRQH